MNRGESSDSGGRTSEMTSLKRITTSSSRWPASTTGHVSVEEIGAERLRPGRAGVGEVAAHGDRPGYGDDARTALK